MPKASRATVVNAAGICEASETMKQYQKCLMGENRCATMLGTETFLCVQESVTLMLSERKELTNQSVLLSFKPFLCLTFAHTPEACAILHTHNPQLSLTLTQSPFLQGHQAREVAKEFPRHE